MTLPSEHEKRISSLSEDDIDEWEGRILKGGCAREHYKLQDCYMDNKDWRKCKDEVRFLLCLFDCRWKHSRHAGPRTQTII
jgi:cytochrome c oxidase assembly factor 4